MTYQDERRAYDPDQAERHQAAWPPAVKEAPEDEAMTIDCASDYVPCTMSKPSDPVGGKF